MDSREPAQVEPTQSATGFGAPFPPLSVDPDKLDVGDVLRTCTEVFRTHGLRHAGFVLLFVGFMLLVLGTSAGIAIAVAVGLEAGHTESADALVIGGGIALFLVATTAALVGYAIMSAGVIHGTLGALRGRNVAFGEMVRVTLHHFFPLLGAGFLAWLAMVGGMILCVVPGIIAGLTLSLVVPIVLEEDLGPVEAITRSAELTRGHRVEIFLVFLAAYALAFLVQMVLSCITMVVSVPAMALGGQGGAAGLLGVGAAGFVYVLVNVVGTVVQQLAIAYPVAVVYARRRGIGPEVDAQKLVDVFA